MPDNPGISFRAALRREFGRFRSHPGDTILVVALNGLLMTAAWFLLPRTWFFTVTGPSGYALALAGWMYSDVTATNVLAADAELAIPLLDDPPALRTVLSAKETALWLLVAPLCVVAAAVCGVVEDDWVYTTFVIVSVAVIPIGALAITGIVGVLFPYHQRSLRWRWDQRHRFHPVILRWSVLTVIPYAVYPLAATLIMVIPFGIWWLLGNLDRSHRVPTWGFAVCVLIAAGIAVVVRWWAHRFTVRWIGQHIDSLRGFLCDPSRG